LPGKVWIINVVGLILQYVLLVLVYYFLYRVGVMIYQDLKDKAPAAKTSVRAGKAAGRQAVLTVLAGATADLTGKVFELGEMTAVGRGEHNDIRIDDGFISHEHSCITRYNNEYWLADLQSTNCTYLNDQQVSQEVLLKSGDIIKIGTVIFKFER
jgi:pSer/pThr/pTyr-binding forkhead associated (FHA) protein